MPIDEYVELPADQRADHLPFIYATDDDRHLIKVVCSHSIVSLVEDRRRYWQTLQYLSGVHEAKLTALHRADIEDAAVEVRGGRRSPREFPGRHRPGHVGTGDVEPGAGGSRGGAAVHVAGRRAATRGRGDGAGRCGPRSRLARPRRRGVVQRLRHLLPGVARSSSPRPRWSSTGRPEVIARMIPGAAEHRRGDPGDRQADRPGARQLRRGDHPMTDRRARPPGRTRSTRRIELLRRRLSRPAGLPRRVHLRRDAGRGLGVPAARAGRGVHPDACGRCCCAGTTAARC